MSGDMLPVIAALLAVPAVVFLILYFALGRRAVVAAVVTALIGAAAGAFFASAGSAMATAVDPNEALVRGAGIGFVGSAGVAGVLAFVLKLLGV
jgi:hypothetical protein